MKTSESERDRLLRRIDEACGLVAKARDALKSLYSDGVPDIVRDDIGERMYDVYIESIDAALADIDEADEQFDRCYSIVSGEWEDEYGYDDRPEED